MRSVRQCYDALATGGDTSSASSAHVLTLLISAHNLFTSRPACSASLRRCTEWEHLRATLNRTFIATTAWTASRGDGGDGCQRDSFERRWDDWHRGRPECAKCSNESSMVSLPYQRSAESANLFWSPSPFCIDQLDKANAPPILIPESRRGTYISLAVNASSHSPTALWGIIPSICTTPSQSKTTRGFNCVRACTELTRPYYCTPPEIEPARTQL